MFKLLEHEHPYFALVLVLIISNIFFAWSFFSISGELSALQDTGTETQINGKILDFTSLFIQKVLKANQEVDFETRLSLENSVRDLKDEEIIAQWQNFVGSKTEADAQESVKDLLEVLVSKVER